MRKYLIVTLTAIVSLFTSVFIVGAWTNPNGNPPAGSNSNALFYYNGNIGIGTSTPAYPLSASGTIFTTGGIRFNDGTTQSTAFSGVSQTMTAGNVSSGAFGSNTGGGNYSFPANVGIGTTSPSAKLDVVGNIRSNNGVVYATATSTPGSGDAVYIQHNGTIGILGASYYTGSYTPLTFWTNGAEKVRIDTSGNVGIGTTSPAYPLTVSRNTGSGILITDTAVVNASWAILPQTNNATKLFRIYDYTAGADRLDIDVSGNVGIGTTNPAVKTEISSAGTTLVTGLRINTVGTPTAGAGAAIELGSSVNAATSFPVAKLGSYLISGAAGSESGYLTLSTSRSGTMIEAMRILDSGNVGIGLVNPSAIDKVTIYQNSTSGSHTGLLVNDVGAAAGSGYALYVSKTGASTVNNVAGYFTASGGAANYGIYSAAGTNYFNGNVGIGITNPVNLLTVNGSATSGSASTYQFRVTDGTRALYLGSTLSAGEIQSTGGVPLALNPAGNNVGIATTTPAYPLTVAGTIFSSTGGVRFPDGTTQTTAFLGGSSQTITAGNVSSGNFGSNTGGGNYTFPASISIATTTAPTAKVDIYGGGSGTGLKITTDNSGPWALAIKNNSATGTGLKIFQANDGTVQFYNNYSGGPVGAVITMNQDNGNVGIGTVSITLGTKLEVTGNISMKSGADSYLQTTDANNLILRADQQTGASGKGVKTQYWNGSVWNTASEVDNITGSGYGNLLLMQAGGNVGIGTTSPGRLLTVNGIADVSKIFTTGNNTYSSADPMAADIVIGSAEGTRHDSSMMFWSSGSASRIFNQADNFYLSTWSADAITGANVKLSASAAAGNSYLNALGGNVGIGTTSPTTDKLVVIGTGTQAAPSSAGIYGSNPTTAGDAQLQLGQAAGASDLKFLVAGTDSRSDGLVANDAYLFTSQRMNLFSKGNGTTYNTQIVLGVSGTGSYSDIAFNTALQSATSVERMRIAGNGNVGIGTTAPLSTLSVGGAGVSGAGVYASSTTYGVYGNSSTGYGVYGTAGSNRAAVYGCNSTSICLVPTVTTGIYGYSYGTGSYGGYFTGGDGSIGVRGESSGGIGIYGSGSSGVRGDGSTYGVFGNGGTYGVYGNGSTYGVYGVGSTYGVFAYVSSANGFGVYGNASAVSGGTGVYGTGGASAAGVFGQGNMTNGYGGYFSGSVGVQTNSCTGCSVLAEMAPVAETPANGDIMCTNPDTGKTEICVEDKSSYIKGIAQKYAEQILRMGCSNTLDVKTGKNSMSLGVMNTDLVLEKPECKGWYPIALSGLSEETNVVCKSPNGKTLKYGDVLVTSNVPGRLRPLDKGESAESYQIAGKADSVCKSGDETDSIKVWIH